MKNVLIKIRSSAKFFVLASVATFIIAGVMAFVFKPIYSVRWGINRILLK